MPSYAPPYPPRPPNPPSSATNSPSSSRRRPGASASAGLTDSSGCCSHACGVAGGGAVQIVKPATVVCWHRRLFAWHWRRRSRPARPGRPPIAGDVRALIRKMHRANPCWGAPRIHGELQKLGIVIAEMTVAKYLGRRPASPSPTWRTFLRTHLSQCASMDFFTVPTATFRVLFVLVILSHDRRRIVHLNVTAHPTAAWRSEERR